MDAADEVDTDDELKEHASVGAAPAEEVDTDEELRLAAGSRDMQAWCLWGSYDPAKVSGVLQGMYQVLFEDGTSRWATASELVLPDLTVPPPWLLPGAVVLHPAAEASTSLVQGRLTRRTGTALTDDSASEQWEVKRDDAAGSLSTHSAEALRLPVVHPALLGSGRRVQVGTRILALRGGWVRATVHGRASVTRGRSVTLALDPAAASTLSTWALGGQLFEPVADAAMLAPGARAVAHLPQRSAGDQHVELGVELVEPASGEARCVADDGSVLEVSALDLHVRMDASFRVLCASAGFQKGELVDFTPDGMYAVRLAGGATRWLSACELTTAAHTVQAHGACGGQSSPPPVGTFVAVAPAEGAGATRWLSGAQVVAPPAGSAEQAGHLSLRRPRSQKPLTLRLVRRDGRFGIGLDAQNRVVELQDGCSAIDAGVCTGDRVLRVDGRPIRSADDLRAAFEGRDAVEMVVSVERDSGMGGQLAWEWPNPTGPLSRSPHAPHCCKGTPMRGPNESPPNESPNEPCPRMAIDRRIAIPGSSPPCCSRRRRRRRRRGDRRGRRRHAVGAADGARAIATPAARCRARTASGDWGRGLCDDWRLARGPCGESRRWALLDPSWAWRAPLGGRRRDRVA